MKVENLLLKGGQRIVIDGRKYLTLRTVYVGYDERKRVVVHAVDPLGFNMNKSFPFGKIIERG